MAPAMLYVGNLDSSVTIKDLYKHFIDHYRGCGVNMCIIVKDSQTKQSLGYGFVQYYDYYPAAKAMKVLDSTMLMNKPIQVLFSPFHNDSAPSVIFIKNLPKTVTETDLFHVLKIYGRIICINLATDASGYAAVRFDCVEAARAAITDLNGKLFWGNYRLHVSSFIMVSLYGFPERAYNKLSLEILGSISKQFLRDFFSPFGHVTSVTIQEKLPKGEEFAVVAFQDSKTADRAADAAKLHPHLIYLGRTHEKTATFRPLGERDAKKIVSKQLHLNLFEAPAEDEQQKTQRSQAQAHAHAHAHAHAQFYQMRPAAWTSPGGSLPVYPLPLPIYSPPEMSPLPGPGFGQQMICPQAHPTLFPTQVSSTISQVT